MNGVNHQNTQQTVDSHFTGPKVVVKSEPELDSFSCDQLHGNDCLESFPVSNININSVKPQRPVSLSLKTIPLKSIEGVSIETPTTCLNFDSLIDGRTGLTPTNILAPININVTPSSMSLNTPSATLTPSCGSQQRHQGICLTATITELSSPSSNTPNLVSL